VQVWTQCFEETIRWTQPLVLGPLMHASPRAAGVRHLVSSGLV
jgi:hypothetical protein